ncbi:MAG: polyprenyl synthetase family protein [Saprospiraceae bacterium]
MSQLDYNSLVQAFETYLASHQPSGSPDSLYVPMRYINSIGGKRIRPALVLMAYNQWHDDIVPALPAAMAVEFFHNFSLMHDDIMDEAALRRGHDSVHVKYGPNLAILSGDAMLIRCFELLLESGRKNNTGSAICTEMASSAMTICEGQQMDMDFENLDSPSEQDYLEMIRKKTASLLGTCLRIGSLLAGASSEVAEILYRCGENIGISFQIKDDILDVFGQTDKTGKIRGGDILRGKKNFLYIHTFNQLGTVEQKEFIAEYNLAGDTGNIEPVLQKYQLLKTEEYALKLQQHYLSQAMLNIDRLSFLNTNILKDFASQLMSRDH